MEIAKRFLNYLSRHRWLTLFLIIVVGFVCLVSWGFVDVVHTLSASSKTSAEMLAESPWIVVNGCDTGWVVLETNQGKSLTAYFPDKLWYKNPAKSDALAVSVHSMNEVPRSKNVQFFNGFGEFAKGSTEISGTVTLEDAFLCKMPTASTPLIWAKEDKRESVGTYSVGVYNFDFTRGPYWLERDAIRELIRRTITGDGKDIEASSGLGIGKKDDWDFTVENISTDAEYGYANLGLKIGTNPPFVFSEKLPFGREIVVRKYTNSGGEGSYRFILWKYRGAVHILFPTKQD